ncbi:MAG: DUF1887 family protein, partial [Clostridia bacterium]|nr:DUF1887 family protein [Clostridia bacterium]
FFDNTAAENICACLVSTPKRVILVGDKYVVIKKNAQRYQEILKKRGCDVEFICRCVEKHNLSNIVETLAAIVEKYDNCVFGLTGGGDLCLVAAGIISERYKDKNIQMHCFNIGENSISDCDPDGNTVMKKAVPSLSVEENVRIYGGDIVYSDVKENGTYRWDMNEEFRADINAMWNICREDVQLWNAQIGVFAMAEELGTVSEDGLTTKARIADIDAELQKFRSNFKIIYPIVLPLRREGLICDYSYDEEFFEITYKNEQVKRCLVKAGQALEMKIYSVAKSVCEDENTPYNDVMNGVYIDWDGEIHPEGNYDTENEIDIMMMRGIAPVFISCKNGYVDANELYKLNTVAENFGEEYSKKVLIATALHAMKDGAQYIRNRAAAMGITLLEGVQRMDDAALAEEIKSF